MQDVMPIIQAAQHMRDALAWLPIIATGVSCAGFLYIVVVAICGATKSVR